MAIKNIPIICALIFPIAGIAQNSGIVSLHCDGTYTDYTSSDLRDVPTKGIYVEISDRKMKIFGAPGFDAEYIVTNTIKTGIGFEAVTNGDYQGFLNRYSGALSITQRNANSDGSWKAKTGINATCKKAVALF